MPRYHVKFNVYPKTDDKSEEVTADKMLYCDGAALFFISGRLVRIIPPGVYVSAKEMKEPDPTPLQDCKILMGDRCACGHTTHMHTGSKGRYGGCCNKNCRCTSFVLMEEPDPRARQVFYEKDHDEDPTT